MRNFIALAFILFISFPSFAQNVSGVEVDLSVLGDGVNDVKAVNSENKLPVKRVEDQSVEDLRNKYFTKGVIPKVSSDNIVPVPSKKPVSIAPSKQAVHVPIPAPFMRPAAFEIVQVDDVQAEEIAEKEAVEKIDTAIAITENTSPVNMSATDITESVVPPVPVSEVPAPVELQAHKALGDIVTIVGYNGDQIRLDESVKKALVTEFLPILKKELDQRIGLYAYTKAVERSKSEAQRLSLSRALEMRSFLIQKGIEMERIDLHPQDSGDTQKSQDRIEIRLYP